MENKCETLKIISFNMKRDSPFEKSHLWDSRKLAAANLISQLDPDIVGTQELTPAMRADMEEMLGGKYIISGFGRYYGVKKNQDEHTDVFIKSESCQLRYCKTFWLSKYPDQYGSKALLAFFPRICTVAEIRLVESGRKIRVFNTHFDHISSPARKLAVRVILDAINRFNQHEHLPTVVMGDMNAAYNSSSITILRENLHRYPFKLQDVYTKFNPNSVSNTYHHFKGKATLGKSPIDYIFVSEEFEIEEAYIYADKVDGTYPSDHFPLVASVRLCETHEVGAAESKSEAKAAMLEI